MHPKMMIALANEVQRNRESELQGVRLRSVAVADRPPGARTLAGGERVCAAVARRY
jgi:hypothetical protein